MRQNLTLEIIVDVVLQRDIFSIAEVSVGLEACVSTGSLVTAFALGSFCVNTLRKIFCSAAFQRDLRAWSNSSMRDQTAFQSSSGSRPSASSMAWTSSSR